MHISNVFFSKKIYAHIKCTVGGVSIICEQKIGACRPCISWKSLASKWADAIYYLKIFAFQVKIFAFQVKIFGSKWPDDATYYLKIFASRV